MLIKTPNKELAFKSVINTWLRDKTYYCNNCGEIYPRETACCENPQVGTNIDIFFAIVAQNKEMTKSRKNEFGSNDDKNIRWGLSLPVSLHNVLDNWKKSQIGDDGKPLPGLFKESGELHWFMKKFPQFRIASKI
jgi:hypothetical protein